MKRICLTACAALAVAMASHSAFAAIVYYSNDFDTDTTASWTVNDNGQGTNAADFYFDYSTVGIPSAPNSVGGSTRGLKLQANISGTGPATGALPGISVSPTGKSFTGDYKLKFDWWHNWLGNVTGGISNAGGGSGSTQISTFGIMTTGTTANYAGASDSVFFAATGDGASGSDYRVYSRQIPTSHVGNVTGATYAAGTQNNSPSTYYADLFPAGATAPPEQVTASATQAGSTLAGTAGFRWHEVLISKSGNIITWDVNGTLVATLDITAHANQPLGSNILFGHSDTSLGAGTPADLFALLDFTLIDNVQVIPEPASLSLIGLSLAGLLAIRRR